MMSDPLTVPKARCIAYVEAQRQIEKTLATMEKSIGEQLTSQLPISRPDAQRIAQEVIARLSKRSA